EREDMADVRREQSLLAHGCRQVHLPLQGPRRTLHQSHLNPSRDDLAMSDPILAASEKVRARTGLSSGSEGAISVPSRPLSKPSKMPLVPHRKRRRAACFTTRPDAFRPARYRPTVPPAPRLEEQLPGSWSPARHPAGPPAEARTVAPAVAVT